MSIPILFQFDNVGGLGASTLELMSPWDLFLFIDLILVGGFLLKTKASTLTVPREIKRNYIAVASVLVMMTIGLGFVKSVHLFSESYNREQMVKSLGPLNYHVYDMAIGFKAPLQRLLVTEADAISTQEYLQNKDSVRQDLFGIAKGKNMVLISLEST